MKTVQTFKLNINDGYGLDINNAVVRVFKIKCKTDKDLIENEQTNMYDGDNQLTGISYRVRFWYDQAKLDAKFRSRPLVFEEEGVFTDVFSVDLDHEESVIINASAVDADEKAIQLVRADLIRKYS